MDEATPPQPGPETSSAIGRSRAATAPIAPSSNDKEMDVEIDDGEEMETPNCRICRGDESSDEPLFHPCKCNGSIRFVHQACLMEWLSRSQKRHCELCKTPFRFTKLYDPQMPPSVPLPVFMRQAVIQLIRGVARINRYILVAFVWLCWVPWTMRTMWRFFFWLGDGAWLGYRGLGLEDGHSSIRDAFANATQTASLTASAASHGTAAAIASANSTMGILQTWFSAAHDSMFPWSFKEGEAGLLSSNASQPLMMRIGRRLLRDSFALMGVQRRADSSFNVTVTFATANHHGTMLSDIDYLQNLSRWPALNRTVIDVLEGQLITLFVMVLIILVFLIREWVVQQQPNLGAPRVPAQNLAIEGLPQNPAPVENGEERLAPADPAGQEAPAPEVQEAAEAAEAQDLPRTVAEMYQRAPVFPPPGNDANESERPIPADESSVSGLNNAIANDMDELDDSSVAQSQRPPMQRHAIDRASLLHRVLEEEQTKASGDKWPGIQTFMDYWNRGDCEPQRVLELIREEGREEELSWIMNAMIRLEDPMPMEDLLDPQTVEEAQPQGTEPVAREDADGSDQSWQLLDNEARGLEGEPHTNPDEQDRSAHVPHWLDSQAAAWPPASNEAGQNGMNNTMADAVERTVPESRNPTETAVNASPTLQALPDLEQLQETDVPHDEPFPIAQDAPDFQAIPEAGGRDEAEAETHPDAADQRQDALQPVTLWDRLANMIWGNVDLPAAERRQVAQQLEPILQPEVEHEAPLPPPAPAAEGPQAHAPAAAAPAPAQPPPNPAAGAAPPLDPEVLRAAREAGVDPEDIQAIEEGEDLDGLVELIGLQGPLIALIQHGMVCGAIVTLVVFFGIWVPYIIGKVVLVLMSNPVTLLIKLPLRWTSFIANVAIDSSIFLAGNAFFWLDSIVRVMVNPIGWIIPFFADMQKNTLIPDTALSFATRSVERLAKTFTVDESFAENDIPYFSVIAHESLVNLETQAYNATITSYNWLEGVVDSSWHRPSLYQMLSGAFTVLPRLTWNWLRMETNFIKRTVSTIISLVRTNPFKMRLDFPERTEPFDLELIHWSTKDRILAILLGYVALCAIGVAYVKMKKAMRNTTDIRDEALEILSQAGGVLKVILIISIEMLAFPLYCGLLLDIAMLPLFQNRSLLSRLTFAASNPLTSIFLHWFVGTCYMFHFALFVSMCRKAMRKGVLYFIRDPDDPTFHPVRDVLERNLVGQLRKILFSALVYGGLVIVCLGAVVWGVAALPVQTLPIKWSSLNPSTELPLDLITLNFLIPVAIKVLDPSQGLEVMYKWWFRRCARVLRLSHFLFNDRLQDEEGYWVDGQPVDNSESPSEKMRAAEDQPRDARASAEPVAETKADQDSTQPTTTESSHSQGVDASTGQTKTSSSGRRFVRAGRFVRAPASDQVRIPRSARTFINVDESNNRVDGKQEPAKEALHGKDNPLFTLIWLPPNFQLRITLFVFLLWAFAAVTGVGITVLPLSFGRYVFANYLSADVPTNDVHAFCFGAYVLGGPVFLAIKYKERLSKAYQRTRSWLVTGVASHDLMSIVRKVFATTLRASRILYFYSFFGIVMPTLIALIFEFYIYVPLGTKVDGESTLVRMTRVSFVQNWILGCMWLKIIGRAIHNNQESRPARALFALVAPANNGAGWWDPDIKLATRAFFLPSVVLVGTALAAPLGIGFMTNLVYYRAADAAIQMLVYRYSYPAVAVTVILAFMLRSSMRAYQAWRSRIRDEVYLVGERLHNFGERRPTVTSQVSSAS